MSLDFALCPKCDGYLIEGTYRRTGITLSSRCRCNDTEWDRQLEAEARERAAKPLPAAAYPEWPDPEVRELPNGRFQVAA